MKLLTETQNEIVDLLKLNGRMSVDQITQKLRESKTAVRRNLLSLERRRVLESEWIPVARGRPQLGFRLTDQATQLFPSKEAELLEGLIRFLKDNGKISLVEQFFEAYWEERYQKVLKKMAQRKSKDFTNRLEALTDVLEDEGFFPRATIDKKNSEMKLVECHCPIAAAARTTSLPCEMEKRLIDKVLRCSSESPNPCEYRVDLKQVRKKV